MLDSLSTLPGELERFWNAGIGIQIQVLILLSVLFLLGYFSAKFICSGVWWKWLLFLIFLLPFVAQIYLSQNIIFVAPVTLGLLWQLLRGSMWIYPFELYERLLDFYLSLRYKRATAEAHTMYAEAEEILRRSKEYENRTRKGYKRQEAEQKRFQEEMKRKKQEQEAQNNKKTSSSPKLADLDPSKLSDAYEILGVPYGASLEECKKTNRLLLSLYHPDKVAHLNESRRQQAEEEAKRINASWVTIQKLK